MMEDLPEIHTWIAVRNVCVDKCSCFSILYAFCISLTALLTLNSASMDSEEYLERVEYISFLIEDQHSNGFHKPVYSS